MFKSLTELKVTHEAYIVLRFIDIAVFQRLKKKLKAHLNIVISNRLKGSSLSKWKCVREVCRSYDWNKAVIVKQLTHP